jgi:hypothetical protein
MCVWVPVEGKEAVASVAAKISKLQDGTEMGLATEVATIWCLTCPPMAIANARVVARAHQDATIARESVSGRLFAVETGAEIETEMIVGDEVGVETGILVDDDL